MTADRPTRVAVDLLDSAAAEGVKQSRSAKQQLDHWAQVGRAVSMHETSAPCHRSGVGWHPADVRAELGGAHGGQRRARRGDRGPCRTAAYGDILAAEGITTVVDG